MKNVDAISRVKPIKLKISWVLIIITGMASIGMLYDRKEIFHTLPILINIFSLEFLFYYLLEVIGYNVLNIVGISLAVYEFIKHKNEDAKKNIYIGIILFILTILIH